jgi:hypothetical protein
LNIQVARVIQGDSRRINPQRRRLRVGHSHDGASTEALIVGRATVPPPRTIGIALASDRVSGPFSGRVLDSDVGVEKPPALNDDKKYQKYNRQDERELDQGLAFLF